MHHVDCEICTAYRKHVSKHGADREYIDALEQSEECRNRQTA